MCEKDVLRASPFQRIIGRKTVGPPAARLPTAPAGGQRVHGTACKRPGPAKEAHVAGKYALSLAPATSPHSKSQPATMATTIASKAKKGKNFSSEEEQQLCRSFLHVSQDPIAGNGQRAGAFWDRIARHYQEHKPQGREDRPAWSLETKWGAIKHDVAKFVAVHSQVLNLKESGTSLEDVLQRALELYRVKHPQQQGFLYIYCWTSRGGLIRLWRCECEAMKTPPPQPLKGRRLSSEGADEPTCHDDDGEECVEVDAAPASRRPQRPTSNKAAKEELNRVRVKESTMRAQARATAEMATANAEKIAVMRDQAALQFFSIPDDSTMSDMAKEYLQLRREEELTKVKRRIHQTKADFECGLPGVVEPHAEPFAVPPVGAVHSPTAGAEGAGRSTMSTRDSSEVATFSVQASDFVGGAVDRVEEFRDAGVHSLGIHRPPIPFPFFPANF